MNFKTLIFLCVAIMGHGQYSYAEPKPSTTVKQELDFFPYQVVNHLRLTNKAKHPLYSLVEMNHSLAPPLWIWKERLPYGGFQAGFSFVPKVLDPKKTLRIKIARLLGSNILLKLYKSWIPESSVATLSNFEDNYKKEAALFTKTMDLILTRENVDAIILLDDSTLPTDRGLFMNVSDLHNLFLCNGKLWDGGNYQLTITEGLLTKIRDAANKFAYYAGKLNKPLKFLEKGLMIEGLVTEDLPNVIIKLARSLVGDKPSKNNLSCKVEEFYDMAEFYRT